MNAEAHGTWRGPADDVSRIAQADALGAGGLARRLLDVGRAGLPSAYDPRTGEFVQTMRRAGSSVRQEGRSPRYTAIAALGLARLDHAEQHEVLNGRTAADLARSVTRRALEQSDPGAIALAMWAEGEIFGGVDAGLLARLARALLSGQPLPTVDVSWMLTAAIAVGRGGDGVAALATSRLLEAQGPQGIFPHMVPAGEQHRWRRHVGSFADQVYPLQALARMFRVSGDAALLDAAEATARRLCELQGPAGQWWWHYDARTGDVVERFPVYSVHQHAMAPMTLFDLAEAGGSDRSTQIVRGLQWMQERPESAEDLVADPVGMIWRKVGRREPAKAVRKMSAVTTSVRPGLHAPFLDRVFPADRVDHECRPYELGWLLYAWLPPREVK